MQRGEALLVLAGLALAIALGVFGTLIFLRVDEKICPACLNGKVETVFSPEAEDEIIGILRGANESLDVEMYLFNYRGLADELVKAKARGIAVRVILEPRLTGTENLEMMKYLRDNGIDARWASLDYKLTHAKTVVVDGKRVLVGSTNWSSSALKKNREYSVLIEDENIASEFLANFEKDWGMASTENS